MIIEMSTILYKYMISDTYIDKDLSYKTLFHSEI